MDQEFMKYLAGLGVGGVLAALFYYQNNKNSLEFAKRSDEITKAFADRIEALLNVEKGRTEMLVLTVKDVTAVMTSTIRIMESLHKRLDHELVHHRETQRITFEKENEENS